MILRIGFEATDKLDFGNLNHTMGWGLWCDSIKKPHLTGAAFLFYQLRV